MGQNEAGGKAAPPSHLGSSQEGKGAGGGRQLTLLSLPSSWCAYLEGAILPTYSILVTPTIAPARPHGSNFLFFNSSVSFLMA